MLHCSVWTSLLWPWSFHQSQLRWFSCKRNRFCWTGKQRFVKKKRTFFWNVLFIRGNSIRTKQSLLFVEIRSTIISRKKLLSRVSSYSKLFQSLNKIGLFPVSDRSKNVFTSIREYSVCVPLSCFNLVADAVKNVRFGGRCCDYLYLSSIVCKVSRWKFQAERRR